MKSEPPVLALQHSDACAVKSYARSMLDNHTASVKQLKNRFAQANVKGAELLPATDATHGKVLDELHSVSSDAFDNLYLTDEQRVHKSAISSYRYYASHGDKRLLKDLASRQLLGLQKQLDSLARVNPADHEAITQGGFKRGEIDTMRHGDCVVSRSVQDRLIEDG